MRPILPPRLPLVLSAFLLAACGGDDGTGPAEGCVGPEGQTFSVHVSLHEGGSPVGSLEAGAVYLGGDSGRRTWRVEGAEPFTLVVLGTVSTTGDLEDAALEPVELRLDEGSAGHVTVDGPCHGSLGTGSSEIGCDVSGGASVTGSLQLFGHGPEACVD